jgi:hypothetical protein
LDEQLEDDEEPEERDDLDDRLEREDLGERLERGELIYIYVLFEKKLLEKNNLKPYQI